MDFRIAQKLTWNCRILDVKMKTNRSNGSKFVVAKLAKADTGEFICSIIAHELSFSSFEKDMQSGRLHTIDRIALQPQNPVYHIYTWDDVEKGVCSREHFNEVQRDKEGKPIQFSKIVIYANFDKSTFPSIYEVLDKEFVDVNSPLVHQYLNFNNQQFYLHQQYEKRKEEQEKYDEMMSDMYDAYENNRYSNMDMTEEDRIMSALENGNGDAFGY